MTALSPALAKPSLQLNVPRIATGAFIAIIGIWLFIYAWTHSGYKGSTGQLYFGLSVMLFFIGVAFLFDKSAEGVGIPALAIIISIVAFGLFIWISKSFNPKIAKEVGPFTAIATMYEGAFGSSFSFQNTLTRAAPLMLTGLCTALPMRVGLVVIGGEGALIVGALFSSGAGHAMEVAGGSPWMVITAMLVVGFAAGAIWMGIVGALKHYRGVNETISSLLMIYVAIALLNHMCEGPWKDLSDPTALNTPSTWTLQPENQIKNLDFSDTTLNSPGMISALGWITLDGVHWGLVYGILACIFCFVLVNHTPTGFAGRVVGGNLKAARVGGIGLGKLVLLFCALGGGAAGLAGAVQVSAVAGKCNANIYADGYGYAGILVAFLAKHNPLAIIPVAILIGGIGASDTLMQTNLKLPAASSLVLQGFLFVVLLGSEAFYGKIKFLMAKEPARG